MKKIISLLLLTTMFLNSAPMESAENTSTMLTLSDVYEANYTAEDVLYITESAVNDSTNYESLNGFMDAGGIIVIEHDNGGSNLIGEKLGMTFTMVSDDVTENTLEESDNSMIDVATLYYECENNVKGTHVISIESAELDDVDALINDAITTIRMKQSQSADVELTGLSPADYEAVPLAILERTESKAPKGKLNVCYTLFSIEDYSSRDYYIIKIDCNGMPGCILYKDYSSYQKKYQSEYMEFSISTDTSSVTIDAYGPHSTVGSKTYSVDIGNSIDSEDVAGLTCGFSYSRNIEDISIRANALTKSAEWTLDLESEAEEATVVFEPAIAFNCPTGKASIVFDVCCTYGVNSWDTLTEDIVSNKSIRCTISSASFVK